MLSKTIVAALLATAAVALPAKIARDSITIPDYILNPIPIDEHNRPGAPEKRDPNSLVKFYIPDAPAPDAKEEPADLDKRFYIYHHPPPGAETVEKRDSNSFVKFYIPDAPAPDAEEGVDLDKRFYIYHHPPPGAESVEKRNPNSLVKFYIPEAPAPDAQETADLDKRFYIYHHPPPGAEPLDEESDETVEKRDLEPEWLENPPSIDQPGRPSTPVKRDPNSSFNFWAPADE